VQGTAAAEGALTGALRSLFAVVEAYPQLKANENVGRLQEELTSTENRIAFARQFYNDLVMRFNTRIQVVPTNVVASLFGFKEEAYFEIPVAEQQPIKVDLR
jgi:LemA protein